MQAKEFCLSLTLLRPSVSCSADWQLQISSSPQEIWNWKMFAIPRLRGFSLFMWIWNFWCQLQNVTAVTSLCTLLFEDLNM